MERVRSGDVDFALQQLFEIQSKPREVQQRTPLLEFDEEVYIARRLIISSRDGAEHAGALNAMASHDVLDLFPDLGYRWSHVQNLWSEATLAPFHITFSGLRRPPLAAAPKGGGGLGPPKRTLRC